MNIARTLELVLYLLSTTLVLTVRSVLSSSSPAEHVTIDHTVRSSLQAPIGDSATLC